MEQSTNLWLYFVVVFGIIVLPGLDMAYVMASSILGGRRAGLAAVGGIIAGGVCHLLMASAGVAVVLQLWPGLFNAILLAGAAYIAWMGIAFMRSDSVFRPGAAPAQQVLAPPAIFRRAMMTSLLNPKAYFFMLAIFPQFLKPGLGPLWLQSGVLGAITALTQAGVYGALAFASSQASGWFNQHPRASVAAARGMGVLLVFTALLSAGQAVRGLAPEWRPTEVMLVVGGHTVR